MKVIVQHLATEYEDQGAGKVMLFLHGWQDSLHTFGPLVSRLSPGNRIIRLDLPGFGKSENPSQAWDLDNYVQFVKDFIQKLDIQVDVLVGHSFGGRIVAKGEATENLRARKIILIGSAGTAPRRTFRNFIFKIGAKLGGLVMYVPPFIFWREQLRERFYTAIGSDYEHAGALKETFVKIVSEDLSRDARNITAPTLLIWGANDTETPLSEGKQLSQLIQGSRLKVVDNAGHFVHREKPEEVARLIEEFV